MGVAVGGGGTILRTEDGGTTWNRIDTEINVDLNGFAPTGNSTGVAVGVESYLTEDRGRTWSIKSRYDVNAPLNGVSFIDERIGIAVGGLPDAILRTEDGGRSWHDVRSPIHHPALFSVGFPSRTTGVVVGGAGLILRTTDAGQRWTTVEAGTRRTLMGLHFPDDRRGWAVGTYGTILTTEDAGLTWSPSDAGTDVHLQGVVFADRQRGVAVGYHGQGLVTADGGRSWVPIQAPTLAALTSVRISPSGRIFVTTQQNAILELEPPWGEDRAPGSGENVR